MFPSCRSLARLTVLLLTLLLPGIAAGAPDYCASSIHKDDLACFGAGPAYCSSSIYKNAGACASSCPAYCSSSVYGDALACAGCRPAYCSSTVYKNSRACGPLLVMPVSTATNQPAPSSSTRPSAYESRDDHDDEEPTPFVKRTQSTRDDRPDLTRFCGVDLSTLKDPEPKWELALPKAPSSGRIPAAASRVTLLSRFESYLSPVVRRWRSGEDPRAAGSREPAFVIDHRSGSSRISVAPWAAPGVRATCMTTNFTSDLRRYIRSNTYANPAATTRDVVAWRLPYGARMNASLDTQAFPTLSATEYDLTVDLPAFVLGSGEFRQGTMSVYCARAAGEVGLPAYSRATRAAKLFKPAEEYTKVTADRRVRVEAGECFAFELRLI